MTPDISFELTRVDSVPPDVFFFSTQLPMFTATEFGL